MKFTLFMLLVSATATTIMAQSPSAAELVIVQQGSGETTKGSGTNFTGQVEVGPRVTAISPSRLGGAFVRFAAGAYTAWHTHPLGQTLHITEGCGWVQVEGQPVREVAPGTVVVIPPGARHWHGASASAPMTHLALAEALDGSVVTWMKHVPQEVYASGVEARRAC